MTNIYKGSDERGALMLEAIALLGLMTMMSPMVVRQTADRTAEMEEVAIAGQMKTLRDAVSSYIDSNYANIAAWANDVQVLTLDDLRPYLPASFIQADGTLGNKLVDDYRVGIRRERPCNDTNPDGSLTDACNRWKITGLISSGTQAGGAGNELDDRRAARIATMIGADGGYIRSTQALNALFPGNAAEANKAIGAQGIWEIDDVTQFFPAGGWQPGQGRVVATTTYTSGIGGDFLYRHAVNGLPEANSMFTDIDMSGMGTGAHRIRHSGGLEVVNGKIIVRDSRNNDWDADAATTISNTELTMQDADVSITKGENTTFTLGEGEVRAATAGGEMGVTDWDAYMAAGGAEVSLTSGAIYEGGNSFEQNVTGDSIITAGGRYDVQSGDNMFLTASNGSVNIKGGSGEGKGINLNTNCTSGTGSSSSCYGLFLRSTTANNWTAAANAPNRMVGGLNLYGRSDIPFSMSTSYRNKNGNQVFLAVHSGFSDNKSLVLHGSTSKEASDVFFRGSDNWQSNGQSNPMLYSADVSLQALGSGATNSQNGGRLQLGANERMRVNLIGRAPGGHMTMYAPNTSGEPVATAVLAASQHKYTTQRGGLFALGTGYTNAIKTDSWKVEEMTGDNNDAVFYMNARTATANMPGFSPFKIALKNEPTAEADYGYAVRSLATPEYNNDGTLASKDLNDTIDSETIKNQLESPKLTGGLASTYYGNNTVSENIPGYASNIDYSRYEVDPAFVSVMNDIKLTSRGGAHLADILPNYINKGIYVLSNTYAYGGWPCDEHTCKYDIPKAVKTTGGALTEGAWEVYCGNGSDGGMQTYLKGGATCEDHDDATTNKHYISVNYFSGNVNDGYKTCPTNAACLTHPFLGAVPAPGHTLTIQENEKNVSISGLDEGPCPDGYVPVMTVTPTAIEVGKVNYIDMRVSTGGAEDDSYVYYNLENITFSSNRASIYQPATSVSTSVIAVDSNGIEIPKGATDEVYGWKVALGTVSTTSTGYNWNQGGVWQDSMKAVAHTYCYFNPTRFQFPNMVYDSNGMLHAMPAPRKTN